MNITYTDKNRKYIFYIAFILILGSALRIYNIAAPNLWFDEAISVSNSGTIQQTYTLSNDTNLYWNPAAEKKLTFLPYESIDPQPCFYYSLLNLWIGLFGNSEFAIRILSAIFGIISIFLVYIFGNALFGRKAALCTALLLSISPIHIWYAQEARNYTLSTFLVILVAYLLYIAIKKNNNYIWATFSTVGILSLYTNYLISCIILSGWILFLAKKNRYLAKKMLITNLCIAAFLIPWAKILLSHVLYVKNNFWTLRPAFDSLLITLRNFAVGYTGTKATSILSLIIFSALIIISIINLKDEKRGLLFSFLLLPITIIFLISQIMPIYIDRQLMLFSPFFYLLVAHGITNIRQTKVRTAAYIAVVLLIIPSLYNYFSGYMPMQETKYHQGAYIKEPFLPAINYIENNWRDGDIIVHSHISTRPSFAYYQKRYGLKQDHNIASDHNRIWAVLSFWPRNGVLNEDTLLLRETLDARYTIIKSVEFDGIVLNLYKTNKS